jgi:transglutaminase-like putative cysteine protease
MDYQDHVGNIIQHFDIPGHHTQVTVRAKSLVEVVSLPPLPASLPASTWNELDDMVEKGDYWEMLLPSHFARPTRRLSDLASELNLRRRDDPLTLLKGLNTALYDRFTYMPESTRVDSPIDDALQARRGVCQDFAHIMIALVRGLRIPCRYVSGYLFHRDHYRSTRDATHAWVEALLPGLGWIGFDPTNNLLAGEQHIRVAIGRDYADVPPTRGIYKGDAKNELSVAVQVALSDAPLPEEVLPARGEWLPLDSEEQAQQQQ